MSDPEATTAVDVRDPATGHVWVLKRAHFRCKLCDDVRMPFDFNRPCTGPARATLAVITPMSKEEDDFLDEAKDTLGEDQFDRLTEFCRSNPPHVVWQHNVDKWKATLDYLNSLPENDPVRKLIPFSTEMLALSERNLAATAPKH